MKFSVIIPIYNAEKYIDRCLQSIMRQDIDDIEIICIDDGSTDSTIEILKYYEKKYDNIIFIQQKRMYAGAARNTGLEIAKGEYIHFLDADDYLFNNVYGKIYEQAIRYNLDILKFVNYCFAANNGEQLEHEHYDYTMANIPDVYFNGRLLDLKTDINLFKTNMSHTPWSGVYRREFLNKNNILFNKFICVNDRSFFVESIIKAKRIGLSDIVVVNHQVGNSNSLVGIRTKNFDCHYWSFKLIESITDNIDIDIQRAILSDELRDILSWYQSLPMEVDDKVKETFDSFIKNLHWEKIDRDENIDREIINAKKSEHRCKDVSGDIFRKYALDSAKGRRIGHILEEKGIDSIYIYGIGEIGRMVVADLKLSGYRLRGVFDKCAEHDINAEIDGYGNLSVQSPSKIPNDNVPILITPSRDYREIKSNLLSQGIKEERIVMLFELLS